LELGVGAGNDGGIGRAKNIQTTQLQIEHTWCQIGTAYLLKLKTLS